MTAKVGETVGFTQGKRWLTGKVIRVLKRYIVIDMGNRELLLPPEDVYSPNLHPLQDLLIELYHIPSKEKPI